MPPALLAAGDFDPIQIAIVVLFVIGGFLKWVWENWLARREPDGSEREMDAEEQRLRDEAWRRQTGQPRRASPPPLPQNSGGWGELRRAWRELKETARQRQEFPSPPVAAPPPLQPPPLRRPAGQASPPARRGSVRETLSVAEQKLAAVRAERVPAPPALVVPAPAAMTEQHPQSPFLVSLQNLRSNPALMRQAILMHEVLGPPKALQSSGDAAI